MFRVLLLVADIVIAVGVALYVVPTCGVKSIDTHVNTVFADDNVAMEAFPFKVGDYNRDVQASYPGPKGVGMSLEYPDDTIAFIVIYNDKSYAWDTAPMVLKKEYQKIQQYYSGKCFNQSSIRFIEANEMHTTSGGLSLPTVQVSIAAHAAGGAYYYQRQQVNKEPDDWANKVIYGVSIHEKFNLGTRFAGVIVFEELRDADFVPRTAVDVAPSDDEKIRILNEYDIVG